MSLVLLQSALLFPLEVLVNGVLVLDPIAVKRLAKLEGKTLALLSTRPEAALYLGVRGGKLHLGAVHEGVATASLRGPALSLLQLLLRGERISNLQPLQLELRGDTAFVQALQELLLDLDLDWEYHLGRLLGDLPAGLVGRGLRETRDYLRQTGKRLHEDAVEYLHEETRLVPHAAELEAFYDSITDLQLRLDRIQARLALL